MEPLLILNRRLKDKYGTISDHARYRIVWSTTETEKRKGRFNDFYGPIFLRTVEGIREVPKYPFYKDRWVLEMYTGISYFTSEVVDHNGYEPLFVFDNNGKYLDPVWRAVEFILYRANSPVKRSASDIADEDRAKEEAEERYFFDYLTDMDTIGIKEGRTIVVPRGV
jgi:hypothetical protein